MAKDTTTARAVTSRGNPESTGSALVRTVKVRAGEIERLRIDKGYSIERLASRSGVHPRTIKRMTEGRPVLIEKVSAVAGALGTTCDALLKDETPAPAQPLDVPTIFSVEVVVRGTAPRDVSPQRLADIGAAVAKLVVAEGADVQSWNTRLRYEQEGKGERELARQHDEDQALNEKLAWYLFGTGFI